MSTGRIGSRIREFREERGLTIEELAEKAGLATDQLRAIEEEGVDPALGLLVKVARVLGHRLGTFIDDELTVDPHIVRKADREACQAGDCKHSGANQDYFPLGRGKADRHMEPFVITLNPEEGEPVKSSHEGEEFIYVFSGEVKLVYGTKDYTLSEGDTMYYNSVVPHWIGCSGDAPATILAVVHVPF